MKTKIMFQVLSVSVWLLCLLSGTACSDSEPASDDTVIRVSPETLSIPGEGGEAELSVKCNLPWQMQVKEGQEWCQCSLHSADASRVVVSAYNNESDESRVARISFLAGKQEKVVEVTQKPGQVVVPSIVYPQVESDIPLPALTDARGNIIPDFSHVGYMGSEVDIPEVPVVKTLNAPSDGSDATVLIQTAIDEISAQGGGAILLKAGTYNVGNTLNVKSSGVVLRGEGEGTKLVATKREKHTLIAVTGSGSLSPSSTTVFNVKDKYVPVGRFWLRVNNPQEFRVGDDVVVFRPGTDNWIHDLKMDQIPPRSDGTPSTQWEARSYNVVAERKVTHILGDTLHFDNPVMMAMDEKYGGGAVFKAAYTGRISGCAVENMTIESEYASDTDNNHGWTAVTIDKAQHCWVRNVTSRYFGYGLVDLKAGARFVTVRDSRCLDAKSVITGGNRYSFCISAAQQCLIIDCEATEGRHDCVTGSRGCGPNAFVRVKCRNTHADTGPHHRWNVGTLYDNIDSDGQINVQDRGEMGSGHGWAGANQVLWNCKGSKVCVQNPWVSANNYSIGTKGIKYTGAYEGRPDGIWVNPGKTVSPQSLFDAQLELRRQTGRLYHTTP